MYSCNWSEINCQKKKHCQLLVFQKLKKKKDANDNMVIDLLFFSLVCETDLQPCTSPTPLPLAGKCYFSAPPHACHLVPPTPDGENLVQLYRRQPWLWNFDLGVPQILTALGHSLQDQEASCMVTWLSSLSACSEVTQRSLCLKDCPV